MEKEKMERVEAKIFIAGKKTWHYVHAVGSSAGKNKPSRCD